VTRGRGERRTRAAQAPAADAGMPPGAPWLLDDVSPAALAMALADWDATDFVGGLPPW
jgi:hypothetical protein